MRKALDKGEFVLYYQPQIHLEIVWLKPDGLKDILDTLYNVLTC
ncbi:hypothetical protein ES708_26514 [subsurface metagenome]